MNMVKGPVRAIADLQLQVGVKLYSLLIIVSKNFFILSLLISELEQFFLEALL